MAFATTDRIPAYYSRIEGRTKWKNTKTGGPPEGWTLYAGLCGWALARAYARSGDRVQMPIYLGTELNRQAMFTNLMGRQVRREL